MISIQLIVASLVHCYALLTNLKFCSAIGVTNQRETTVVWDKSTGKPLYNALGNLKLFGIVNQILSS